MSKSAQTLVFCRLFSHTNSLISLSETLLSFSLSMGLSCFDKKLFDNCNTRKIKFHFAILSRISINCCT